MKLYLIVLNKFLLLLFEIKTINNELIIQIQKNNPEQLGNRKTITICNIFTTTITITNSNNNTISIYTCMSNTNTIYKYNYNYKYYFPNIVLTNEITITITIKLIVTIKTTILRNTKITIPSITKFKIQ